MITNVEFSVIHRFNSFIQVNWLGRINKERAQLGRWRGGRKTNAFILSIIIKQRKYKQEVSEFHDFMRTFPMDAPLSIVTGP